MQMLESPHMVLWVSLRLRQPPKKLSISRMSPKSDFKHNVHFSMKFFVDAERTSPRRNFEPRATRTRHDPTSFRRDTGHQTRPLIKGLRSRHLPSRAGLADEGSVLHHTLSAGRRVRHTEILQPCAGL